MPPEALNGMAEAPTSTPEGGVQTATLALAKSWDMYSFGLMVAALFNRQVVPFPDVDERLLIVKVTAFLSCWRVGTSHKNECAFSALFVVVC